MNFETITNQEVGVHGLTELNHITKKQVLTRTDKELEILITLSDWIPTKYEFLCLPIHSKVFES